MHLVIEIFIHRVFYFFKITFADAGTPKWTVTTVFRAASVNLHLISPTMRVFNSFKRQLYSPGTFVIIASGKVAKAFFSGILTNYSRHHKSLLLLLTPALLNY